MTLKDGKKDMFHLSPAKEKLAAAGATVFAVGVGKYINQEALNFIASDPPASHVFQIGDAKVISDKIFQASEVSCATVGNNDTKGTALSCQITYPVLLLVHRGRGVNDDTICVSLFSHR